MVPAGEGLRVRRKNTIETQTGSGSIALERHRFFGIYCITSTIGGLIMKLSCLQENLSKGLGIVGRAVATRTTLPITNNVLLETGQSQLKLVATNLEMAISYWVGAQIEEEGTITVPASSKDASPGKT